MKVLVDYQIFLAQQYGGISNYHSKIHQLINEAESGNESTIIALGSNNKYIKSQLQLLKPLNNWGKRVLRSINQYTLERAMPGFDVFHPTYYDNYFLKSDRTPPFVITIHDLIPEKFFKDARGISLVNSKKNLIGKASKIIAISETTKRQILNFYDIDPDSIAVIPHGRPDYFYDLPQSEKAAENDQPPYILYVGLRNRVKNFTFFLQSAAPFLIKYKMHLKIAGPPPSGDELKLIESLTIASHVSFQVFPPLNELYDFYQRAFCFAFPALEEGFGIPLMEAAAAECPIVCSDIEIFHEVCGDSALYFDPYSQESIQAQLEKLFFDSPLREQLIRKGTQNLQNFSWHNAAKKTLDVYHRAAQTA